MNTQSTDLNSLTSTVSNDDLIVVEMIDDNEVIEEMLCNTAY